MKRLFGYYTLPLLLFSLLLVMPGCDESHTNEPPDDGTQQGFTKEYDIGEVTVFSDVAYSRQQLISLVVGYIDSLGDGNTRGVLANLNNTGTLFNIEVLPQQFSSSVAVIKYDEPTAAFVALGSGLTSRQNLFRRSVGDSVSTASRIPYTGTEVYPTELFLTEDGGLVVSGWVVDAGIQKAFILKATAAGAVLWSNYISEPDASMRAKDMIQDDSGFVIATSIIPVNPMIRRLKSRLYFVSENGTLRHSRDILIEGFDIVGFERKVPSFQTNAWDRDSGHSVTGNVYSIGLVKDSAFIGIVDNNGDVLYSAELYEYRSFTPIALDGYSGEYVFKSYIVGNYNDSRISFSFHDWVDGYRVLSGTHQNTGFNSAYINYRTSNGFWLSLEVKDYERNSMGEYTRAIAVLRH